MTRLPPDFTEMATDSLFRERRYLIDKAANPTLTTTAPTVLAIGGLLFGACGVLFALMEGSAMERAMIGVGLVSGALLFHVRALEKARQRRLDAIADEIQRRR